MTEPEAGTEKAIGQNSSASSGQWKSRIALLAVGFVAGAGMLGLIGWQAMPGMMLTVHESKYADVDQTCEALKSAIESHGWKCPAVRDMNKAMAKHGVQFDPPVRIVELCRADYAKQVLTTNPEVSTLMPCAWGVYEGPDGKVYISGMNMGLMGKMFGGTIAEVMGKHVAEDEVKMLHEVVR